MISCGDWTIQYDSTAGVWNALKNGRPLIVNGDALIDTIDKQWTFSSEEYSRRTKTCSFEDELGKGMELSVQLTARQGSWINTELSLRLYERRDWIFVRMKLQNVSDRPQYLRELHLLRFSAGQANGGLFIGNDIGKTMVMSQGFEMEGVGRGMHSIDTVGSTTDVWSPFVASLHNPATGDSASVGFSRNERAFNWVNVLFDRNYNTELMQITAQSSYMNYVHELPRYNPPQYMREMGTGLRLSAGQEVLSDEVMINFNPDALAGLEEFGEATGRRAHVQMPGKNEILWQSWNSFVSEDQTTIRSDILQNNEAFTKLLKPWGFNSYSCSIMLGWADDDWAGEKNRWNDFKETVARGKESEYPFISVVFHPKNVSPDPLSAELVTLGFNSVHTDFMVNLFGQGQGDLAMNPGISHAELFRKRYRAYTENIRHKAKELGVKLFLVGYSGTPMGLSVGLVNGNRVGADNGHGAYRNWGSRNPSRGTSSHAYQVGLLKSIMPALAYRWWMHNRIWKNYIESVKVGEPLGIAQARAWASLVGLSGQMFAIADKVAGEERKYIIPPLNEERLGILRKVLPACDVKQGEMFRPVGLWKCSEACSLPGIYIRRIVRPWETWNVVGLFNLDDKKPRKMKMELAEMKWEWKRGYLLFDFWEEKFIGRYQKQPALSVAPYGCRVLAVHEDTGHPQVLSSNRHITQGGVDLEEILWDKNPMVLQGISNGYPMQKYSLWVYVPLRFRYKKITASVPVKVKKVDERVLRLDFNVSGPESIRWMVHFGSLK